MTESAKAHHVGCGSALWGAILGLTVTMAGCGGNVTPAPTAPTGGSAATFERIQKQVFDVSCSSDSCHSSVGQAGNLILEEGKSYDNLVNHTPSNPVATAEVMMRVMAGQPDRSLLYAKITSNLQ